MWLVSGLAASFNMIWISLRQYWHVRDDMGFKELFVILSGMGSKWGRVVELVQCFYDIVTSSECVLITYDFGEGIITFIYYQGLHIAYLHRIRMQVARAIWSYNFFEGVWFHNFKEA